MKNLPLIALLFFVSITTLSSCKKDDDNSSISNNNSATTSLITSGSWHISYFHENNNDHTSNFSGYTFLFNSNGTMSASNSSGTTNGTWSNDDSQNELHFSIGASDPLADLNKGWIILSKTSTEIKLQDDNSTHTEELHFTKN